MTKAGQREVNAKVEVAMNEAVSAITWGTPEVRLRSCNANVLLTSNYYVLRSYRTFVAVIDRRDGTLYDSLRTIYGYTATSAQHIAKFSHDYGGLVRYVARPV